MKHKIRNSLCTGDKRAHVLHRRHEIRSFVSNQYRCYTWMSVRVGCLFFFHKNRHSKKKHFKCFVFCFFFIWLFCDFHSYGLLCYCLVSTCFWSSVRSFHSSSMDRMNMWIDWVLVCCSFHTLYCCDTQSVCCSLVNTKTLHFSIFLAHFCSLAV